MAYVFICKISSTGGYSVYDKDLNVKYTGALGSDGVPWFAVDSDYGCFYVCEGSTLKRRSTADGTLQYTQYESVGKQKVLGTDYNNAVYTIDNTPGGTLRIWLADLSFRFDVAISDLDGYISGGCVCNREVILFGGLEIVNFLVEIREGWYYDWDLNEWVFYGEATPFYADVEVYGHKVARIRVLYDAEALEVEGWYWDWQTKTLVYYDEPTKVGYYTAETLWSKSLVYELDYLQDPRFKQNYVFEVAEVAADTDMQIFLSGKYIDGAGLGSLDSDGEEVWGLGIGVDPIYGSDYGTFSPISLIDNADFFMVGYTYEEEEQAYSRAHVRLNSTGAKIGESSGYFFGSATQAKTIIGNMYSFGVTKTGAGINYALNALTLNGYTFSVYADLIKSSPYHYSFGDPTGFYRYYHIDSRSGGKGGYSSDNPGVRGRYGSYYPGNGGGYSSYYSGNRGRYGSYYPGDGDGAIPDSYLCGARRLKKGNVSFVTKGYKDIIKSADATLHIVDSNIIKQESKDEESSIYIDQDIIWYVNRLVSIPNVIDINEVITNIEVKENNINLRQESKTVSWR